MSFKPYDWQVKALSMFKDAKACMLKVCCGGGKTFVGGMLALHKALPVIVIAPNTLCQQWKDELIEHIGVAENDIWVYSKPEHTKGGEKYEQSFEAWLEN